MNKDELKQRAIIEKIEKKIILKTLVYSFSSPKSISPITTTAVTIKPNGIIIAK